MKSLLELEAIILFIPEISCNIYSYEQGFPSFRLFAKNIFIISAVF